MDFFLLEVMPKERSVVVVVDCFPADAARVPKPLRMWSFTGGHPKERYRSGYFTGMCAPLCIAVWWVVQWQFPGVAVCQCVWLVNGMDEEVVVHTAVVGGLLCFLCIQLDAVWQVCVSPLDGGELHVTYCGFGLRGMVGDDPVELEW